MIPRKEQLETRRAVSAVTVGDGDGADGDPSHDGVGKSRLYLSIDPIEALFGFR